MKAFVPTRTPGITRRERMMKVASSIFTALFLLLLPVGASAQSTSSTSAVTGIATDTTGAVISGATVKLTSSQTAQEKTTTTNEQGVYLFAQVPPEQNYTLTFSAQGFQTLSSKMSPSRSELQKLTTCN